MPRLPFAHVRVAIVGVLAVAGLAAFTAAAVAMQAADDEILADSELALYEEAGSGAYQHYAITLRSRDGQVTLTTNKDGAVAQLTITGADAVALWRAVLENGLETLATTPAADAVPDASEFTVKYRLAGRSGEFSAVGVDALPDGRYRAVVRAILALATRYTRARG